MSTKPSMSSLLGFILRRPTPPQSMIPPRSHATGTNYDTSFSRKEPVRKVRALLLDAGITPLTRAITKPTTINASALDGLERPLIFVANHQSHLDTPLVLAVLPPQLRHHTVVGAGADFFFDRRTKGFFSSTLLGAIPIDRVRPSRASAELAIQLLEEGWNLVLFPEGGRTPDGLTQELKSGAAQIAIKVSRPVVPLFIDGTYEIYGKTNDRIHPGSTTVVIGEPLFPRDGEKVAELNERITHALGVLGREAATDFFTARQPERALPFPAPSRSWVEAWRSSDHRHHPDSERKWPKMFGSRN
jgi:1-acyl-sn-glycerol-3-phosphate acyltransferase